MINKLDTVIKRHALRALKAADGSATVAAEMLGIGRATLYRWLPTLGLETKGQKWERLNATNPYKRKRNKRRLEERIARQARAGVM